MASYKRTSKVGTSSALSSNSDEKEANTEVSPMSFTLVLLFPEIIHCFLYFWFTSLHLIDLVSKIFSVDHERAAPIAQ